MDPKNVAALGIIVLVIVVIYLVADLHKTTRSVRQFLEDENHSLQLTLREVNRTLEHLRHVIVQLSGFVNSQQTIDKAGEIARSVQGVTSVKNNLIVK